MRKKNNKLNQDDNLTSITEHISDEEITELLDENYMRYTFAVMEDRALPEAKDGLKPSQRRILVAMNDLRLNYSSSTEKCAKICGETSGNYHPHGEAIVYPTLIRMAQDWVLRYPLIKGQGNLGNVGGDPPAAMRYTEAKLSRAGEAMLSDLSEDVVPYVANYNEKLREPTILPSILPNLIVNGGSGIAVGVACKLAPHNLREVTEVIKAYIANPNLTVDEIISLMPGPDFPTGGILRGQKGVRDYYEAGRGSLTIDGIYEITEGHKGAQNIVITGLPYGSSPEKLAEQIEELVKEKKIDGITDLKDLSHRKNGQTVIQLIVEVGKGGNANLVLNQLLKSTSLRVSFDVNQTILIDGKVVENAPLKSLIKAFVDHRQNILTNKFNAELKKNQARVHILDGLLKVSLNIDKAIKLIRASDNADSAIQALLDNDLVDTEIQAKAVLAITLRQLTKLEANSLETERKNLLERNEWLTDILGNNKKLLKYIAKEQEDFAKLYGDDRRTIIGDDTSGITAEDLIPEEQIIISLTKDGYIKRVPVNTYRVQKRGGKGMIGVGKREADEASDIFTGSTHELFLFFSNKGIMYRKKGYQIPEASRTGKGIHLANLLSLSAGEVITNTITVKTLDQDGTLVIVTKNGLIKRTDIREYDSQRISKKFGAIKLEDNDEVQCVTITDGKQDIVLITQNGMAVRYSENIVRKTARMTKGCQAMNLAKTDCIVSMLTLDKNENPDVLVVTTKGYAKKTLASEYRCLQGRYAKGVRTIDIDKSDRNGAIVSALIVTDEDTLLFLTNKGTIMRMAVAEIKAKGRSTMGSRAIKIEDDTTQVVSVITASCEEDEEEIE